MISPRMAQLRRTHAVAALTLLSLVAVSTARKSLPRTAEQPVKTTLALVDRAAGPAPRSRMPAFIEPPLDPKSDKKFFKKDYPDDEKPRINEHYVFDHPYPLVQDPEDFDKDYVKDENGDNGQWKAQMTYDTLRTKVMEEEKKLITAEHDVDEHLHELEDAKKGRKKAVEEADKAEAASRRARREAKKAARKVDDLAGEDNSGGAVADGVAKVEKEMKDLEDCKKQLAESRDRLKKLMKEQAAQEEAIAKEEKIASEKLKQEEREAATEAAADERKREAHLKKQDILRKQLAKEEAERKAALKSYEEELTDVKEAEDDLARAAERLRSFRGEPPKPAVKSLASPLMFQWSALCVAIAAAIRAAAV